MKILAFDTSNVALSVAILDNEHLLATQTTNIKRNHSSQLMPIIDQTIKTSGLDINDIDRIVVAEGPGSYTGLRIAVTTAKTLAYAINAELIGVSSLALLAQNDTQDGVIAPFFNARQGNVFAGVYDKKGSELKTLIEDQHISFEDLLNQINQIGKSVNFITTDFKDFRESIENTLVVPSSHLDGWNALPNAYFLGLMGLKKNELENVYTAVPQYLRVTEAERNWKDQHPNDVRSGSYVRQID